MNRYYISRFKGLVYGPKEFALYIKQCASGSFAAMQSEFTTCQTVEEHWNFALKHFAPCQIPSEIFGFLEWAVKIEPKVIVEVGVAKGGTNYLMRTCIPSVRKVIGVDYFPRNTRLHNKLNHESVELNFIRGASASEATLSEVKARLGDQKADLIFIDGDHSYQGAMADYHAYLPFLKEGGWIAFHDIVPQQRNAKGEAINGFGVDVDRIWNELSAGKESVEFIDDPKQHSYGIGVLRVEQSG